MPPKPPARPETATLFMGILHGLAYDHLACRYDVRFKVNEKGHYVVALIWGNDQNLRYLSRCQEAMKGLGPQVPPRDEEK